MCLYITTLTDEITRESLPPDHPIWHPGVPGFYRGILKNAGTIGVWWTTGRKCWTLVVHQAVEGMEALHDLGSSPRLLIAGKIWKKITASIFFAWNACNGIAISEKSSKLKPIWLGGHVGFLQGNVIMPGLFIGRSSHVSGDVYITEGKTWKLLKRSCWEIFNIETWTLFEGSSKSLAHHRTTEPG